MSVPTPSSELLALPKSPGKDSFDIKVVDDVDVDTSAFSGKLKREHIDVDADEDPIFSEVTTTSSRVLVWQYFAKFLLLDASLSFFLLIEIPIFDESL